MDIPKLFDLSGENAVVTGAGSGIGAAIARALAGAGASVAVLDLVEERAAAVAKDIEASGRRAVAGRIDVGEEKSIEEAFASLREKLGPITILVNNAGIFPNVPIAKATAEVWDRVQRVNLRGTFLCTKAAALEMRGHGRGGCIINISSIEGRRAYFPGLAPYSTSKAGVDLFTQNAALEFASHKVRVNAIAPGAVRTEGTQAVLDAGFEGVITKRIPLGRVGTPDEIAAVAVFLASRAASYVTGQTVYVDGGIQIT